MTKRPSMIAAAKAAKAAAMADPALSAVVASPPPPPVPPQNLEPPKTPGRNRDLTDSSATTAIHIPKEDLALLRRVAVERANRDGGRPSVSDVIRDLIERNRPELEREAGR